MKVLMVITSHDQLGNTGRKTGFWLEELAAPYYVFKDAGVEITLASPKGGRPPLDPKSNEPEFRTDLTLRFEKDAAAEAQLDKTLRLDSVKQEDFDTVFYPGGHGPMWDLVEDKHSIKLIESFLAAGKTIGIVHPPGHCVTSRCRTASCWCRAPRVHATNSGGNISSQSFSRIFGAASAGIQALVSNRSPHFVQVQRLRTNRSLTNSDQSGAISASPHLTHVVLMATPPLLVLFLRFESGSFFSVITVASPKRRSALIQIKNDRLCTTITCIAVR